MSRRQDATPRPWKAKSREDRLLLAYATERGGQMFVEVPIGGPGGSGNWPEGCTVRRLDGVHFPEAHACSEILRFLPHRERFEGALKTWRTELIEVKPVLNRGSIGQAIAGRHMFERQYGFAPNRTIVLCDATDSALEWVCERERIVVEVRPIPERPRKLD